MTLDQAKEVAALCAKLQSKAWFQALSAEARTAILVAIALQFGGGQDPRDSVQ